MIGNGSDRNEYTQAELIQTSTVPRPSLLPHTVLASSYFITATKQVHYNRGLKK
jgi:hypothetical protein